MGFVLVCVFCVNWMHPEGKTHTHNASPAQFMCYKENMGAYSYVSRLAWSCECKLWDDFSCFEPIHKYYYIIYKMT